MELSFFSALFLGLIQGMSEFLPISSSGHLVVFPWIFRLSDPGLAFDVALHAGTLVAVLVFFRRDWLNVLGIRGDMPEYRGRPFFSLLAIATLPGAVVGFFLEPIAETALRHPLLVALTLALFGSLLLLADRYGSKERTLSTLSLRDAMLIGIAQAISLVPGVSRSGITITMALARGFDRVSAARFSFLLSTPIILGAALSHMKDFLVIGWNPIFVAGIASSAASGYIAIRYLLRFVERASYAVFFRYRIALAGLIVILFFFRV